MAQNRRDFLKRITGLAGAAAVGVAVGKGSQDEDSCSSEYTVTYEVIKPINSIQGSNGEVLIVDVGE